MNEYIVDTQIRPAWVQYPPLFQRLVEQRAVNLCPWHIFTASDAMSRMAGLAVRYPSRHLFPFAYRQDNDDLACWAPEIAPRVLVIHDFASPGWESREGFSDFTSWFRMAVEETINWD